MGTTDNNIWLRIQEGLRETERLMNQNQYNIAMIKARQTLEFMVNCLGERALIVDGDLADSIDQLFEGRFISQTTRDHLHRIRVLGNKAVHEGDDSPYDAGEACKLLSLEVNAFANSYLGKSPAGASSSQRPQAAKPDPISLRSTPGRSVPPRTATSRPSTPRTETAYRQGGQSSTARRPEGMKNSQRGPERNVSRPSQRPHPQSRSRKRSRKKGFDPMDLLKPAVIFLVLLVIIIVLVKLIPGKHDKKETTVPETSVQMSTEAVPTTEALPIPTEPETEAPKTYTTTSKLNVRSQPSTDSAKLGSLASGTVVEYVETYDDKWTVILFEGKQAYVASEYLSVSQTESEAAGTEVSESTTESIQALP